MNIVFLIEQYKLKQLKCRFGCSNPAVGVFHTPMGCVCFTDEIQALCAQHAEKVQSTGPITCILDFYPEGNWRHEKEAS
jgi:hypothetical protein